MIDPHVHLRDWGEASKETLRHGLSVAWRAGLDGVFEMPNTDPPLTSRETILRRIEGADRAISGLGVPIFHGLYAGITDDPAQIGEVVRLWRELFPRVVGLKMFAGHSTGNMGIVSPEAQAAVYARLTELGFTGVLAVHCEKEQLLRKLPDGSPDWNPARPSSHAKARPPASEVASVNDQVETARRLGFGGTLHIAHISTPFALDLLRGTHSGAGEKRPLAVSCGLTPHHALLSTLAMEGPDGMLLKTNPPLRPEPMPSMMLSRLIAGEIDWIETDHAPHTLKDKREGHASGIPGLPFLPRFVHMLKDRGMPRERIEELTHEAVCRTFKVQIPDRRRAPEEGLAGEYEFDPFRSV
jgi:dihydroorotase